MISRLVVLSLLVSSVFGQTPAKSDLLLQAEQLQALIAARDWAKAAELSRSLKEAVAEARNSSLSAQGAELTDSILTWLPADTETLVVAQLPFPIPRADDHATETAALPAAQDFVLGLLGAAEEEKY
jgi:hypothetical protein